jgi:4-azaleucine resistance transporter AzlC
MPLSRKSFWAGVRAEIPLLIGVFPFGLLYGATALAAGLTSAQAQGMSSIVFAGTAQFITAQLVHEAAPAAVIVLTIAVVNLRHVLYSASMAPYVEKLPTRWKTGLAYLLTDEAYAASIIHYEEDGAGPTSHFFFLGAALALWVTWQISTALGIFLGTTIPQSWPLEFAIPLTFIAMVVPTLKDKPVIAAAATASVAAVLTSWMPYKLGLIAAALAGIAAGVIAEGRR